MVKKHKISLENTTNEEVISLVSTPMEELDVAEAQQYDSHLFADAYKNVYRALSGASERVSNFIGSYSDRLKLRSKENRAVPYSQKQKGFTLTELLVTIAITGGLMAILLPSLQRTRKEAKAIVCQSNERQWGVASSTEEDKISFEKQWQGVFGSNDNQSYYNTYKNLLLCPMAMKPKSISPVIGYGGKFSAWNLGGTIGSYGWNCEINNYATRYPELENHFKGISRVPLLFDRL